MQTLFRISVSSAPVSQGGQQNTPVSRGKHPCAAKTVLAGSHCRRSLPAPRLRGVCFSDSSWDLFLWVLESRVLGQRML